MSNKILGIFFIVIAVIAVIVYFPSGDKTERTFRTELMDVDTSAISEIIISPKSMNGESFRIFKANSQWNVTLPNEKTAVVPMEKIDELIKQILSIKPVRLAARSKVKWAEFEVDSPVKAMSFLCNCDLLKYISLHNCVIPNSSSSICSKIMDLIFDKKVFSFAERPLIGWVKSVWE